MELSVPFVWMDRFKNIKRHIKFIKKRTHFAEIWKKSGICQNTLRGVIVLHDLYSLQGGLSIRYHMHIALAYEMLNSALIPYLIINISLSCGKYICFIRKHYFQGEWKAFFKFVSSIFLESKMLLVWIDGFLNLKISHKVY